MRVDTRRLRPSLALIALAVAALLSHASPVAAQNVSGAGSTLAQPLLNRWSQQYLRSQWTAESQPVGGLDYEAVGSQAGVMRIKERAVDFAATEVPLSPDELKQYGVVQFPIAVAGVVAAVNLPGVKAGALKLSGELIADIYLGKVGNWSDPAIKALNPDVALPDAAIVPVRRSDGSGTTFAFTSYLATSSAAWRPIGAGLTVAWPAGRAAKGNTGVAEAVKQTPNAIGYLDFATARLAGLSTAALQNGSGAFIAPAPDSFQTAAAMAEWSPANDFGLSLIGSPDGAAYPVVTATFVLVPNRRPISTSAAATIAFFDWAFEHGAKDAAALGYVALPASLLQQIRGHWTEKLDAKSAVLR